MTTTLEPIADEDWPAALAALQGSFLARGNVYRVMAHHPALLAAWQELRTHVVRETRLGRKASEVVILRTAHRLDAAYEWAHHVVRGRAAGLEDARIRALAGPLEGIADARDRPLAEAVDELTGEGRLAPETRARLLEQLGAEAVLDLMATVGFYTALGFIVRSFETPVDAEIEAELAARPLG